MLDVRVYRAAFLPALIAVFVAAFSLADRPVPTTTGLSADAFDASTAFGDTSRPQRNSLNELARTFPNREAGSTGDARLADRVAETFEQKERGTRRPAFEVSRSSTQWDGANLETVVGVRPGLSNRRIVVVAHRDARGHPGRAELSGTAALLELARLYRQRELRKTLVLVSTSGATTGFAGARAWARDAAAGSSASPVDAVLVLGDMAGRRIRKPWVVPWTGGGSPAPLALQRTVESALRAEVSAEPGRVPRLRPVDPARAAADDLRAGRGRRRRAAGDRDRHDRRAGAGAPTSPSSARGWRRSAAGCCAR